MKKVTHDEIVELAVNELGWTSAPTTDLVMATRHKFHLSDKQAGILVGKVLDLDLIRQVTKEEWERLSPSSMTTGMLSVPTTKFRWIKNEE